MYRMRSYACFVENFEDKAIFVGCLLDAYERNIDRVRKSVDFRAILEEKYADFSSLYEYNMENLEKYFGRWVVINVATCQKINPSYQRPKGALVRRVDLLT